METLRSLSKRPSDKNTMRPSQQSHFQLETFKVKFLELIPRLIQKCYGESGVIGDRAFHREPHIVAALAAALQRGLSEGGLASCGKHFPGHGYIRADSHHEVPVDERDYAAIERRTPDVRPYGGRTEGACHYTAEQTWYWDGDEYDLTLRLTEQCGDAAPTIHKFSTRYYAVSLVTLERLLREAGFEDVVQRDEHFFQPLMVARNPVA